jgi:hypothetical protein
VGRFPFVALLIAGQGVKDEVSVEIRGATGD